MFIKINNRYIPNNRYQLIFTYLNVINFSSNAKKNPLNNLIVITLNTYELYTKDLITSKFSEIFLFLVEFQYFGARVKLFYSQNHRNVGN